MVGPEGRTTARPETVASRALDAMVAAEPLGENAHVTLLRGQVALEHSYPEFCVDITRDRCRRRDPRFVHLMPPWETVMGLKRGTLDEEHFAIRYYQQLGSPDSTPSFKALHLVGRHALGTVRLLCFCPDGKFCHTHLCIAYAVSAFPQRFRTPYNYTTY